MPVQSLSTPYLRRPHLRPADILISQNQNESRFVPSSLVPTEIVGEISLDALDLTFKYISPESPDPKRFRNGNVELEIGRSTKKILRISLLFESNHAALISAIEQAIKTVKLARSTIDRPSIQKSYNVIANILLTAKRDFSTDMKRDLEEMFRHARKG